MTSIAQQTLLTGTSRRERRRRVMNTAMLGFTVIATLIALVPLGLILSYVVIQGADAFDVSFLSQTFKPMLIGEQAGDVRGGVLHAIVGSALIVGVALLMAVPIGVLAGMYLSERTGSAPATIVRFAADVLTAMPSIVVGVVAYVLIVQRTARFSGIAGSIALAVLMVPVVTRTTEEMLRLVPQGVREAAAALGVPQWRYTLSVVLPMAFGGIATGILLAFARAMGETAPLLVTVLGNNELTFDIFGPMQALPLVAYRYTEQPFTVMNQQAWGAALILVSLVLLTNISVRLATRRYRLR